MDEKLAAAISAAPTNVLTKIVKLAQWQGSEGTKGSWKDFLNVPIGSSLSDPCRWPRDALVSFLKTLTREEDKKLIDNVLGSYSRRQEMLQFAKQSSDDISPEQRLVHLTLEHPLFMSKYDFPTYHEKGWLVTKPFEGSRRESLNKMLAVDCEMVLCENGTDAVVRVCVVDSDLQVVLDEKVIPGWPISDYRSEITGIYPGDLDNVTCSLRDIQRCMEKLLCRGRTILVGHGLYNDLLALKIDHIRVVDTSLIFKTSYGRMPSLRSLCKTILGYELRKEGAPHDCLDDTRTAMKIVLAMIKLGIDNVTTNIVSEDERSKLLLHKIPNAVPSEALRSIFPANFTVELKPPVKNAQGKHCSVLAVFKNPQQVDEAFGKVNGVIDKDSAGRPQKLVRLVSNTGKTATVFVRKMMPEAEDDDDLQQKISSLDISD
ncbi:Small RNA degrading nuclease 3 [Linum grandiflorum]